MRWFLFATPILLGATLLSAAEVAGTRSERVVVTQLTSDNLSVQHLQLITASLLAEMRKLVELNVAGMDEIRAMLSADEQDALKACASDQGCIADVTGALGADVLVLGEVARVGESSVISVRMLDTRTGSVRQEATRRMRGGTGEEFLEAVGPLVSDLFPSRQLRFGAQRGVASQVVARWNAPPIKPLYTLAVGTAAAGGLLAAGIATVVQKYAEHQYSELHARSAEAGGVSGRDLVAVQRRVDVSFYTAVTACSVGVLLGAGAGVMALFTDWAYELGVTATVAPNAAGIAVEGRL